MGISSTSPSQWGSFSVSEAYNSLTLGISRYVSDFFKNLSFESIKNNKWTYSIIGATLILSIFYKIYKLQDQSDQSQSDSKNKDSLKGSTGLNVNLPDETISSLDSLEIYLQREGEELERKEEISSEIESISQTINSLNDKILSKTRQINALIRQKLNLDETIGANELQSQRDLLRKERASLVEQKNNLLAQRSQLMTRRSVSPANSLDNSLHST